MDLIIGYVLVKNIDNNLKIKNRNRDKHIENQPIRCKTINMCPKCGQYIVWCVCKNILDHII